MERRFLQLRSRSNQASSALEAKKPCWYDRLGGNCQCITTLLEAIKVVTRFQDTTLLKYAYGGRYWIRTSDPTDVNRVLYR